MLDLTLRSRALLGALSLSLAAACGGSTAPAAEPAAPTEVAAQPDEAPPEAQPETPPETAPEAPAVTRGPGDFPMPEGAGEGEAAPAGIMVFKIPRGKDAVVAEIKALLAADGWTIDKEEVSPRGAVRMDVSKDGKAVNARLTGDDAQAALILTVK